MIKYLIVSIAILFSATNINAQSLAINADGSTANASALLDIKSTEKGLLIPRMNKAQRNSLATPATGLLVFQNAPDSIGFYYYDGGKWNWMAAINGNADTLAWKRKGNSGTDTAVNFIGTIDSMPLRFKLNDTWAGQWDAKYGNYFIGRETGFKTTPTTFLFGKYNIGIGNDVLSSNISGYYNIALGYTSLSSNTSGTNNIGLGYAVLLENTTGNHNIGLGSQALWRNTTGNHNFASGQSALIFNTTGSYNCSNGFWSLRNNTTGSHNIASGNRTLLENTTGSYNIAIGDSALHNNIDADNNIALGHFSLKSNTTGTANIALGARAMEDNVDGSNNVAVGYGSLSSNVAGTNNVGLGQFALSPNRDGANNIVIGNSAMGSFNYSNGGNSFNSYNIAIGRAALSQVNPTNATANTSGKNNIGIGAFSMQVPTTGYNNTAIGYNSEITGTNSNNSTALGANATASGSDYVRIGSTGVNSIFGAVAFNTSDGRFKTNVQNNVPGLDFIMGLRPVTYHFEKVKYSRFIGKKQDKEYVQKLQSQDAENKTSTGFIAQEVEALAKKLNYSFDGLYKPQNDKDAYGLGYQQFVTPLIKAVQEQQQLILQQDQLIKQQQVLYNDVLKRLAVLESK